MLNSSSLRSKYRNERRLLGIYESPDDEPKKYPAWESALFLCLLVGLVLIGSCSVARAEVDMNKVMMIESGGRNVPSNIKSEHAIGLFQITPVVLKEYNQLNKKNHKASDLFDTDLNTKIAYWYLNIRIPQMLKAYGKPATVRNILIAYNAGISYVVKNKPLPAVTVRYLRKYGVL